ncbi:MAG: DUF917 domain-containing protein [Actinomycetota bacterium]
MSAPTALSPATTQTFRTLEPTSGVKRRVLLGVDHLPALARGCALFGGGGGGDPTVGLLMAREAIQNHGPVPLVDLDDLPADGLVLPCGYVGAPTVLREKLQNGWEGRRLVEEVESLFGRSVVAIMPIEIGGANGMVPLNWAARLRLPYVDADGMGRAFPTIPQMTMNLAGVPSTPCVIVDERMNTLVVRTGDVAWTEHLLRTAVSAFGGAASGAMYVMTVATARAATVRRSVSRALNLGSAVLLGNGDPVAALVSETDAIELIRGKVVEVARETSGRFVRGSAVISDPAGNRLLRLEIQNEFLVALEEGYVQASVPDIITVIDLHTGEPIVTERLRFGQQVSVVSFPVDPAWRTAAGLALTGPAAFGYDVPYVPVEMIHARPI